MSRGFCFWHAGPGWKRPPGRPSYTQQWRQTLHELNIGFASAWRKTAIRDNWRRMVDKAKQRSILWKKKSHPVFLRLSLLIVLFRWAAGVGGRAAVRKTERHHSRSGDVVDKERIKPNKQHPLVGFGKGTVSGIKNSLQSTPRIPYGHQCPKVFPWNGIPVDWGSAVTHGD